MDNPLKKWLSNKYVGHNTIVLDDVDSTNEYAKNLLNSDIANGTVIIAKNQILGRGQKNNSWESHEGGLFYTCVMDSRLSENTTMITLATGIACQEAIKETTGLDTYLKWINDINCNQNKLGGILVESRIRGQSIKLIIGIGINLNNDKNDLSSEIRNIATTVYSETGKKFDIYELAANISNKLENISDELKNENYKLIKSLWLQKSKSLGKKIRTTNLKDNINGIVIDINLRGELIIQLNDGSTMNISNSTDIKYI